MTPHNKEEIIKNYISTYNCFDIEAMCVFLHQEIEFINIDKTLNGIDAFKSQAKQTTAFFKTRQQEIITIIYGDNHVKVEINYVLGIAEGGES